jgi:AraC family transcriptional activator of pyochelin receptor
MYIDRSQRTDTPQGSISFQFVSSASFSQGKDVIAVEALLEEGSITIVEMRSQEYSLWFTDFRLNSNVQLTFGTPPWPALGLVYSLAGDVYFSDQRLAKGVLKKQHGYLFHLASSRCTFHLEKGNYTLFGAQFSESYMKRWAPYVRHLPLMHERLNAREPFLIQGDPAISANIERIVGDLYCYPNLGPGNETFIDSRAIDLLRFTVESVDDPSHSLVLALSGYEIMKLREAREYILEHLNGQVSVTELEHRAGLNSYTFRTGFTQLFGTTPYQFLIDQRLEKAKKLIEETDLPIKVIAAMISYKSDSAFINVFRARFGIAPGRLRFKKP